MSDWPAFLAEAARREEAGVLVTIAATRGSVPREAGTRMVVFPGDALGTVGGGHLEFRALEIARELLREPDRDGCRLERFPLGPALGQCCGGTVQLLFERMERLSCDWVRALESSLEAGESVVRVTELVPVPGGAGHRANTLLVSERECRGELSKAPVREEALALAHGLLAAGEHAPVRLEPPLLLEPIRPEGLHIALFGAGHVGRAVAALLGALPCRVTWIDQRADEFPLEVPPNVRVEIGEQPEFEVDALPADTYVLVMTHNHALDQAICERVLRREDLPWCGLIGSLGKRRRFERRLRARGLPAEALAGLICPIGIDGISGKRPGEIALAVCAQIFRARERGARLATTPSLETTPSKGSGRAGDAGVRGEGRAGGSDTDGAGRTEPSAVVMTAN